MKHTLTALAVAAVVIPACAPSAPPFPIPAAEPQFQEVAQPVPAATRRHRAKPYRASRLRKPFPTLD